MAIFDTSWYLNYGNGSSTGYYAVTQWAASHAYSAGQMVRQLAAPSVGNERIFICVTAGTSGGSEPTWALTYGAKTTDNAATWMEVTGRTAVNGDQTNTNTWTALKNKAVVLGQLMVNGAGDHYFIVTTAGTTGNGSEPSWNTTTGATTTDNSVTWTCIGAVGSFSAFGAPHARLQAVMGTGFMAAGNSCYIASAHAETQSTAMSLPSSNGTSANPLKFICTDTANAPPANSDVTTGASVATTGASTITIGNSSIAAYFYGINFLAGNGSNSASINILTASFATPQAIWMENCTLQLNNSNSASAIGLNNQASTRDIFTELRNCSFLFGSTSQSINFAYQYASIAGGSVASSGSVPSTLFKTIAQRPGNILIRDCDLSAITGTLLATGSGNGSAQTWSFYNCKLGSGVTLPTFSGGLGPGDTYIRLHNCDSGATNYRYYYAYYYGTAQQETTVVRSGSNATDGTTPISWNVTTSANSTFYSPFISEEIAQWNDATGSSKTATVYLTSNASLNNNDVWMSIEYPSSSSYPLGASTSTKMALLGTPAALTSDSSSWGGSITNKYKMSVSFTPQMKGPVKLRLHLAKASATVYVDPYIYIQ